MSINSVSHDLQFRRKNELTGALLSGLAPDAGICKSCLEDTFSPFSRRFRYPFNTCLDCGPRFSITNDLPFSRDKSSLSFWPMCTDCLVEFNELSGRRFCCETIACHACGPRAKLAKSDGRVICIESYSQLDDVDAATTVLQKGAIVAIKGMGGYQLVCDATNEQAVEKLRAGKKSTKPFALMARELGIIEQYCRVDDAEKKLLLDPVATLVVLTLAIDGKVRVAPSVCTDATGLAFMLPPTGLHHLLLKRMNRPIVVTSGNRSGESPCTDDRDARSRLGQIADYFLGHERLIVNCTDDSLVRLTSSGPLHLRFSAGYAPAELQLPSGFERAPDIFGAGIDLNTTFCLFKNGTAILSHEFSDLSKLDVQEDFRRNVQLSQSAVGHRLQRVAVDINSKSVASGFARTLVAANENISVDEIQQHHAYLAACLADNDYPLDTPPILGVALGGSAVGLDGTVWGGEFLHFDYAYCERFSTFKPVRVIGYGTPNYQPWLDCYAHIKAEMGWPRYKMDFEDLELTTFFESQGLENWDRLLSSEAQSPLASSCDRLFNAVAAALGLGRFAPDSWNASRALESLANFETLNDETDELAYPFQVPRLAGKGIPYLEPLAMWQAVLGDLLLQTDHGVMSARFHKGLAKAIAYIVKKLCTRDEERWTNTVALGGPAFQNKILVEQVSRRLTEAGFQVLTQRRVPGADAGLSFGQAIVSAARTIKGG